MKTKYLVAMMAAWFTVTAGAQSGSDLLQKGLYAQETQGDLDGAIQLYRQVIAAPGTAKQVAAQAQYQLVLSMLQKGDRPAASRELDLLTRNFPDQQDFISRARKLVPGGATLLAPSWAAGEASQLNIKRDGVFTGEYLYYAAMPVGSTENEQGPKSRGTFLHWRLATKTSTRSIEVRVDPETLQAIDRPRLTSNDVLGDASAVPFAGPATDLEPLVFRMRMLPLSVGYKTTLSIHPFVLGSVERRAELTVTAVEPVQTVAGKFSCYKVSFPSLGQFFWIGVDGARPLVKFQSGPVEAELVKTWGPNVFVDTADFMKAAGWSVTVVAGREEAGETGYATGNAPKESLPMDIGMALKMRRFHTPATELQQVVEQSCSLKVKQLERDYSNVRVRENSLQNRKFGGYPAQVCLIDFTNKESRGDLKLNIAIGSENMMVGIEVGGGFFAENYLATFRWLAEPLLDTIKLP